MYIVFSNVKTKKGKLIPVCFNNDSGTEESNIWYFDTCIVCVGRFCCLEQKKWFLNVCLPHFSCYTEHSSENFWI